MIHIALNHWRTAAWMRTQVVYIRRFLAEPFRLVACVEDIRPSDMPEVDEVVEGIGGNHAGKLNLLGHRILATASSESDELVFLGATMLPIASSWLTPTDGSVRLLSMTDDAFYPSVQPHPAFCSTTVGLWESLPGDWAPGYESLPDRAAKTMAGANLLDRLRHAAIPWGAYRSVESDPRHPESYATFGHVLYHHGSLVRRLTAGGFGEAEARSTAERIRERLHRGEPLVGNDPPPDAASSR